MFFGRGGGGSTSLEQSRRWPFLEGLNPPFSASSPSTPSLPPPLYSSLSSGRKGMAFKKSRVFPFFFFPFPFPKTPSFFFFPLLIYSLAQGLAVSNAVKQRGGRPSAEEEVGRAGARAAKTRRLSDLLRRISKRERRGGEGKGGRERDAPADASGRSPRSVSAPIWGASDQPAGKLHCPSLLKKRN